MADKNREPEFTVTDRRKFTDEGDIRPDVPEAPPEPPRPPEPERRVSEPIQAAADDATPAPPTAEEQSAQHAEYQQSTARLDSRLQGHPGMPRPEDLEVSFERFVASIYMSALMQLGLVHHEGESPRADLIGARQTIDTISMLGEKTKGNLTKQEQDFLQNCLYELRMAFIEVTNAFTRMPPPGTPPGPIGVK